MIELARRVASWFSRLKIEGGLNDEIGFHLRRTLTLMMLVAVATDVTAQGPQVLAARHADGRVVVPWQDFPWRDAAPATLRNLEGAIPNPSLYAELARLNGDFGVELRFEAPLPGRLRSLHYLSIHAGGVTPLHADALAGAARFELPQPGQPIRGVVFFGDMRVSAMNNHTIGGGFVLMSDQRRTATTAPSRYTADELMAQSGSDYFARGTAFWTITTQFSVVLSGDKTRYVFVQWAADTELIEIGCQFRYSLYRLDRTPTEVATNHYGCDV